MRQVSGGELEGSCVVVRVVPISAQEENMFCETAFRREVCVRCANIRLLALSYWRIEC